MNAPKFFKCPKFHAYRTPTTSHLSSWFDLSVSCFSLWTNINSSKYLSFYLHGAPPLKHNHYLFTVLTNDLFPNPYEAIGEDFLGNSEKFCSPLSVVSILKLKVRGGKGAARSQRSARRLRELGLGFINRVAEQRTHETKWDVQLGDDLIPNWAVFNFACRLGWLRRTEWRVAN